MYKPDKKMNKETFKQKVSVILSDETTTANEMLENIIQCRDAYSD